MSTHRNLLSAPNRGIHNLLFPVQWEGDVKYLITPSVRFPTIQTLWDDVFYEDGESVFLDTPIINFKMDVLTSIKNKDGDGILKELLSGCTSLKGFYLPSLVKIPDSCFEAICFGCTELTEVNLLNVTTVGRFGLKSAFRGCTKLSEVNLENVISVSDYSFQYTFAESGIKKLKFPNLTSVSNYSFAYVCYKAGELDEVDFSGITNISSNYSFANAFNATTYTGKNPFSNLVSVTGNNVFEHCWKNADWGKTFAFESLTTVSGNDNFKQAFVRTKVEDEGGIYQSLYTTTLGFPKLVSYSGNSFNCPCVQNIHMDVLAETTGQFIGNGESYDFNKLVKYSGTPFSGKFDTINFRSLGDIPTPLFVKGTKINKVHLLKSSEDNILSASAGFNETKVNIDYSLLVNNKKLTPSLQKYKYIQMANNTILSEDGYSKVKTDAEIENEYSRILKDWEAVILFDKNDEWEDYRPTINLYYPVLKNGKVEYLNSGKTVTIGYNEPLFSIQEELEGIFKEIATTNNFNKMVLPSFNIGENNPAWDWYSPVREDVDIDLFSQCCISIEVDSEEKYPVYKNGEQVTEYKYTVNFGDTLSSVYNNDTQFVKEGHTLNGWLIYNETTEEWEEYDSNTVVTGNIKVKPTFKIYELYYLFYNSGYNQQTESVVWDTVYAIGDTNGIVKFEYGQNIRDILKADVEYFWWKRDSGGEFVKTDLNVKYVIVNKADGTQDFNILEITPDDINTSGRNHTFKGWYISGSQDVTTETNFSVPMKPSSNVGTFETYSHYVINTINVTFIVPEEYVDIQETSDGNWVDSGYLYYNVPNCLDGDVIYTVTSTKTDSGIVENVIQHTLVPHPDSAKAKYIGWSNLSYNSKETITSKGKVVVTIRYNNVESGTPSETSINYNSGVTIEVIVNETEYGESAKENVTITSGSGGTLIWYDGDVSIVDVVPVSGNSKEISIEKETNYILRGDGTEESEKTLVALYKADTYILNFDDKTKNRNFYGEYDSIAGPAYSKLSDNVTFSTTSSNYVDNTKPIYDIGYTIDTPSKTSPDTSSVFLGWAFQDGEENGVTPLTSESNSIVVSQKSGYTSDQQLANFKLPQDDLKKSLDLALYYTNQYYGDIKSSFAMLPYANLLITLYEEYGIDKNAGDFYTSICTNLQKLDTYTDDKRKELQNIVGDNTVIIKKYNGITDTSSAETVYNTLRTCITNKSDLDIENNPCGVITSKGENIVFNNTINSSESATLSSTRYTTRTVNGVNILVDVSEYPIVKIPKNKFHYDDKHYIETNVIDKGELTERETSILFNEIGNKITKNITYPDNRLTPVMYYSEFETILGNAINTEYLNEYKKYSEMAVTAYKNHNKTDWFSYASVKANVKKTELGTFFKYTDDVYFYDEKFDLLRNIALFCDSLKTDKANYEKQLENDVSEVNKIPDKKQTYFGINKRKAERTEGAISESCRTSVIAKISSDNYSWKNTWANILYNIWNGTIVEDYEVELDENGNIITDSTGVDVTTKETRTYSYAEIIQNMKPYTHEYSHKPNRVLTVSLVKEMFANNKTIANNCQNIVLNPKPFTIEIVTDVERKDNKDVVTTSLDHTQFYDAFESEIKEISVEKEVNGTIKTETKTWIERWNDSHSSGYANIWKNGDISPNSPRVLYGSWVTQTITDKTFTITYNYPYTNRSKTISGNVYGKEISVGDTQYSPKLTGTWTRSWLVNNKPVTTYKVYSDVAFNEHLTTKITVNEKTSSGEKTVEYNGKIAVDEVIGNVDIGGVSGKGSIEDKYASYNVVATFTDSVFAGYFTQKPDIVKSEVGSLEFSRTKLPKTKSELKEYIDDALSSSWSLFGGIKTKPQPVDVNNYTGTGGIPIYAVWLNVNVKSAFTLYTFDFIDIATGITVKTDSVANRSKESLPTTLGSDYVLPSPNRWYYDENKKNEYDFDDRVRSDVTVYANVRANVTFNSGLSEVSVNTQTVNLGSKATRPATPTSSGNLFIDWYSTSDEVNDFSKTITKNTTINGKWLVKHGSPTLTSKTISNLVNNSNYYTISGVPTSANNIEIVVHTHTPSSLKGSSGEDNGWGTHTAFNWEYCFSLDIGLIDNKPQIGIWNYGANKNQGNFYIVPLNGEFWVKFVKSGTSKTYYYSTDGSSWKTITPTFTDTKTSGFSSTIYIGNHQTNNRAWDENGTGVGKIMLADTYVKINGKDYIKF